MARIYLSSTSEDLKEFREKVYRSLRRCRHDVIAMEDYVTGEYTPLEKCLEDVAANDYYIGIFAWRYGYVPTENNPNQKSITELEYRKAQELGKACLIFLLDEEAPWLPKFIDAVNGEGKQGKRIKALRKELSKEKIVSFFSTADELANLVSDAVYLQEIEELKNKQFQEAQSEVIASLEKEKAVSEEVQATLKAGQQAAIWLIKNREKLAKNAARFALAEIFSSEQEISDSQVNDLYFEIWQCLERLAYASIWNSTDILNDSLEFEIFQDDIQIYIFAFQYIRNIKLPNSNLPANAVQHLTQFVDYLINILGL